MLGSVGVSGRMMMPMKAALAWVHPKMSPPPTSARTNALQWLAAHLLGADLAPSMGSTSPPPSPLDVIIQRGGGVNLQPASRVVTRGLSATTSGVGVAVRGGGGPSIIYQSDYPPPVPPRGKDDKDDDNVRPYFCALREGVAWAAPTQTQVV
jgi:hypothetical protein